MIFDEAESTIETMRADIEVLKHQSALHDPLLVNVDDLGATGYVDTDISESPIYSDKSFANAVEIIADAKRGGVILLSNATYYLSQPILISACPGLEIRGPGGHYQTYRTFAGNQGLATICQADVNADTIQFVSHGDVHSSLLLRDLSIRGMWNRIHTQPTEPGNGAAINVDTTSYAANLRLSNVAISDASYGIRTGAGTPALCVIHLHVDHSYIARCHWGIHFHAVNAASNCISIEHSSIRANGNYMIQEDDYSTARGGGVYIRNATSTSVRHCNLESNSTGLYAERVYGSCFDNNYYENNMTAAMNLVDCHGISARCQMSEGNQEGTQSYRCRLKDCDNIDVSMWATREKPLDLVLDGSNRCIQDAIG